VEAVQKHLSPINQIFKLRFDCNLAAQILTLTQPIVMTEVPPKQSTGQLRGYVQQETVGTEKLLKIWCFRLEVLLEST